MKIVGNEKNIYIYKAIFQYRKFRRKKNCSKRGRHIKFRKTYITIFLAPMVHWPEVMVTYEQTEKILFSADGFGKFGALDVERKLGR